MTYELHIRRGRLINDDPQKRCYNGAYFASHIEWEPWEPWELWLKDMTYEKQEDAEQAARLFCRDDQQVKAVLRTNQGDMKTNELTGVALDWAVAKCEYPELVWGSSIGIHHASHQIVIPHLPEPQCYWNPSDNWAQGGPIIEREKVVLGWVVDHWVARKDFNYNRSFYGRDPKHPLEAAMRCYVASKLGEEVDVPEELTP